MALADADVAWQSALNSDRLMNPSRLVSISSMAQRSSMELAVDSEPPKAERTLESSSAEIFPSPSVSNWLKRFLNSASVMVVRAGEFVASVEESMVVQVQLASAELEWTEDVSEWSSSHN